MREVALVLAMMVLGVLITIKSDRQSIHILEGQLHKLGRPKGSARIAYEQRLTRRSLVQFAFGMGMMATAIIFWLNDQTWTAAFCGAFSISLCSWGALQRIRAFIDARADISR